jgi:hypothetical protein
MQTRVDNNIELNEIFSHGTKKLHIGNKSCELIKQEGYTM